MDTNSRSEAQENFAVAFVAPMCHWLGFANLVTIVDEAMLRAVERRASLDVSTDLVNSGNYSDAADDFAADELAQVDSWRLANRGQR